MLAKGLALVSTLSLLAPCCHLHASNDTEGLRPLAQLLWCISMGSQDRVKHLRQVRRVHTLSRKALVCWTDRRLDRAALRATTTILVRVYLGAGLRLLTLTARS